MSKRGQVTVFIIIGLIILFAVGALFFIRSYVVEERVTQIAQPFEELPAEFEPIRVFTENCLKTVAEQGLIRLGQQGGYIYPDVWDNLDFDETKPTDADGLTFPGSELKLPYWWYNHAKNGENQILFASQRPSLEKMQADLSRFITAELPACLDSYSVFKPQDFEIVEGSFETKTQITDAGVKFLVTHPLAIKKGVASKTIENFYVEIPLQLKHMYDVASLITETEKNSSFVEANTLSLIEIFSAVDNNKLPPMSGTGFDLVPKVMWSKTQVIQDLKEILVSYTPLLRFLESRNFYVYQYPESEYSEVKQRAYNNMILPLTGASDLDVRFQYLDFWEPYTDFSSEGELIRPQSLTASFFGLGRLGVQRYDTFYDLSYPLFVSLNSPQALNGQDYQFNFALEANIRNNNFINSSQEFPAPIYTSKDSLICDENQRNSGLITVRAVDAFTGQPLAETAVSFDVGDKSCFLGLTDENGLLQMNFPVAIGGAVSAAKNSYLSASQIFDTFRGQTGELTLQMWQFKEINLAVLKKKLFNCKKTDDSTRCFFSQNPPANALDSAVLQQVNASPPETVDLYRVENSKKAKRTTWLLENNAFNLAPNEKAIVMLTRLSDFEEPFTAAGTIINASQQPLQLVPGNYTLTLQILLNEEYVIPKEERCYPVIGQIYEQCVDLQEMRFNVLPAGGAIFTQEHALEIEASDLYAADTIYLFGLGPAFTDIPYDERIVEDLQVAYNIENLAVNSKSKLQPIYT